MGFRDNVIPESGVTVVTVILSRVKSIEKFFHGLRWRASDRDEMQKFHRKKGRAKRGDVCKGRKKIKLNILSLQQNPINRTQTLR